MFEIDEKNMQDLLDVYNLLNQLEVKGIQNINILGNAANLLQNFISKIKVEDKTVNIDKTKKEEDSG